MKKQGLSIGVSKYQAPVVAAVTQRKAKKVLNKLFICLSNQQLFNQYYLIEFDVDMTSSKLNEIILVASVSFRDAQDWHLAN